MEKGSQLALQRAPSLYSGLLRKDSFDFKEEGMFDSDEERNGPIAFQYKKAEQSSAQYNQEGFNDAATGYNSIQTLKCIEVPPQPNSTLSRQGLGNSSPSMLFASGRKFGFGQQQTGYIASYGYTYGEQPLNRTLDYD